MKYVAIRNHNPEATSVLDVLNGDYISREMAIMVGDIVDLIELESEWAWVSNNEGECGWIPLQCLECIVPGKN